MYAACAIDGIILGFLLIQTFLGFRRGLLWQAAGAASLAFGVLLGWYLAPVFAPYLYERVTADPFKARLVVFLFVLGTVGFGLRLIAAWAVVRSESGVPKQERENRRAEDRILGGIFGALKACVICMVLVGGAASLYPNAAFWPRTTLARPLAVAGTRLLPPSTVRDMQRWAIESAGDLKRELEIR